MKSAICILLTVSIFIFNPFKGLTQNNLSDKQLKAVAYEIIESADICSLITLDKEGQPRARAMDGFLPDENFVIWFGTTVKSRKVEQIKNDPRITLYYLDSDKSGYVSIYGKAELVNDDKLREKYWKDEWEAFYPDKESDYLLIKVIPKWMEIISIPNGINGDAVTWTPAKVIF
ncbi:MAG: hypothetical protein C0598_03525 [Marinilabiliales bacterium]|nr:MAG: hypothetical protein C0598_03525 [Marinilabiliales bacterium]